MMFIISKILIIKDLKFITYNSHYNSNDKRSSTQCTCRSQFAFHAAFPTTVFFHKVLFKMDMNGGADMVELAKVLNHLQMELRSFQTMCIVAGCDYLKNIRGIGIKRAKDIVSNCDYEDILAGNPNAPSGYVNDLHRVECIFRHQTVFNVNENCLTPLHPNAGVNIDMEACGQYPLHH